MWVSDLMSSPAITVSADMPVKAAARVLRDRRVAAAPVVDRDGALVGIVSEIDLLSGSVFPDPVAHLRPVVMDEQPPVTVADVMVRDVQVLHPHSDPYDAARVMESARVRSMPVVDDGNVVGVVSRADLLRTLARDDEDIAADVRNRLVDYFGGEIPCTVTVLEGVVTISGASTAEDAQAAEVLAERVSGVVRVHCTDRT